MENNIIELGQVSIKPANWIDRIKQSVGLLPKVRSLEIKTPTARITNEICLVINELESLDIEGKEGVRDQINPQIPLFVQIICIALDMPENELQHIRKSILDDWTFEEIATAVAKVYSTVNFKGLLALFEVFGKIKTSAV